MGQLNCMSCGDAFEPEHSKNEVCRACYEHELATDESSASQDLADADSNCSDCSNNHYL